jgi:hypothetical protein
MSTTETSTLTGTWNLDTDLVRECQVSSANAVLQPLQRGFALLEPQPGKDRLLGQ